MKTAQFSKNHIAQVLEQSEQLRIHATHLIEGWIQGTHGSPRLGQSSIFREHAEYVHGEDLRRIDWKASARRQRPVVKRFEHETQLHATLLIDLSSSMHFKGGARHSKAWIAALLGAAVGELLLRQGDSFTLMIVDDEGYSQLSSRGGFQHAQHLYRALSHALSKTQTTTKNLTPKCTLPPHAQMSLQSAICIAISDFVPPANAILPWLATKTGKVRDGTKAKIQALQLLSPEELSLPYDKPCRFENAENQEHIDSDPQDTRETYLRSLQTWQAELRAYATRESVHWQSRDTSTAPSHTLATLLETMHT